MKPAVVRFYNVHMGCMDRVDQQLHGIQDLRKSYKWYKKLIFCLLLQVSLNSHKVYQKCTGSNMVFIDYLTNNIKLMIALTPPIPAAINYAVPQSDVGRITGRDFPMLIPLAPGATFVRIVHRHQASIVTSTSKYIIQNLIFKISNINICKYILDNISDASTEKKSLAQRH